MKLGKKAFLIFGLGFLGLILVTTLVSYFVLVGSFRILEQRETFAIVENARKALQNELATLDSKVADWSAWDETYAFVQDGDPGYLERNISPDTYELFRVNVMAFVNLEGDLVYGAGYDLQQGKPVPIAGSLQQYWSKDSPLLAFPDGESGVSGLISLPEGILLVVSRPVIPTDHQGPARGAMIAGRYLDAAETGRLAEAAGLSLVVQPLEGKPLAEDFQTASQRLSSGEDPVVLPLSRETVAGYTVLLDLEDQPAILLRADNPRDIYKHGLAATGYFLAWLALASLGFIAALGLFIRSTVTHRVGELVGAARRLAGGDIEGDVSVRGEDELGQLAKAFRQMIAYQQHASQVASEIAQGNLNVECRPQSEKDVLGKAFAHMVASLRDLVGEMASSAESLGAASCQLAETAEQSQLASAQIAETIQQVVKGIEQQAESINHIAASVDQTSQAIEGVAQGAQEQAAAIGSVAVATNQISTAIQEITANTDSANQDASRASETARVGIQAIEAVNVAVSAIIGAIGILDEKVREMGRRSEQVGIITETIDDIASQTNLLALNAAIEAARAGEHGKGFAVVAAEVRKLAEKAGAATKEIRGLVEGIQETIGQAAQAMDNGSQEVENTAQCAQNAGDALRTILEATDVLNRQITRVSGAARDLKANSNQLVSRMEAVSAVVDENVAATEKMASGMSEVSITMETIASVSQESSAAVEEVSASVKGMASQASEVASAAQALSNMAEILQDLVRRFRLGMEERETNGQNKFSPLQPPPPTAIPVNINT